MSLGNIGQAGHEHQQRPLAKGLHSGLNGSLMDQRRPRTVFKANQRVALAGASFHYCGCSCRTHEHEQISNTSNVSLQI